MIRDDHINYATAFWMEIAAFVDENDSATNS